jgi:hypothetical protein
MSTFSLKAISATIGEWHWDGFADPDHDPDGTGIEFSRARARRVELAGGPSWAFDEPIDEDWAAVVAPVAHVARRAIEGGQLARHASTGAFAAALAGRFRDLARIPTVRDLREDPREPRCRVELHEVRVELRTTHGQVVRVGGTPRRPQIVAPPTLPVQALRAARYAQRITWLETQAALEDAAARIGDHVPTLEQSLERVAGYAWS